MTHITETEYGSSVVEWFENTYGADFVETQAYQPEPRWFPDITVDAGWCHLAVELENDWPSVRHGIGQAGGYAGKWPVDGIPMVVVPKGHIDDIELRRHIVRSNVLIREFDAEAMQWVETVTL